MARTKLSSATARPFTSSSPLICATGYRGGEFEADQRIPSKAAIAADYDVSLRTVDTAVGVLKADGTLAPTPGKRMFIVPPEQRAQPHPRRRATDR